MKSFSRKFRWNWIHGKNSYYTYYTYFTSDFSGSPVWWLHLVRPRVKSCGECGIVKVVKAVMALFAGIEGEGERFRRPPIRKPRSAVSAEDDLGFLLNLSGVPKNFLFSSAIETYFGLMELWPIFEGHNLSTICAAFSFEIYKKE